MGIRHNSTGRLLGAEVQEFERAGFQLSDEGQADCDLDYQGVKANKFHKTILLLVKEKSPFETACSNGCSKM
jgi:hypothetical protein